MAGRQQRECFEESTRRGDGARDIEQADVDSPRSSFRLLSFGWGGEERTGSGDGRAGASCKPTRSTSWRVIGVCRNLVVSSTAAVRGYGAVLRHSRTQSDRCWRQLVVGGHTLADSKLQCIRLVASGSCFVLAVLFRDVFSCPSDAVQMGGALARPGRALSLKASPRAAAAKKTAPMMSAGGFVPDMGRRQLMNAFLLGSVAGPLLVLPAVLISYLTPAKAGGGGSGTVAKDALGNDVKVADWIKANPAGSRKLVQGLKVSDRRFKYSGAVETAGIAVFSDQGSRFERGCKKRESRGARDIEFGDSCVCQGDATYLITKEDNTLEDFGVNAVCTHLGCVVPWNKSANKFMCPCHGSQYDKNGKVR